MNKYQVKNNQCSGCLNAGINEPSRAIWNAFHKLRVLGGIAELENIMSYCYGTENYYKIPQYSFKYTDGVKTFCEKADAYWLLDIVASISRHYKQMHEDFIIIDLIVGEDNKASITFEDTKGIFFKQEIPFTDLPKKQG